MRITTLFVLLFACSWVSAINYTITAPATPILEGNSTNPSYTFTITRSDTTDAVDIGVNIVLGTASGSDLATFTNQTVSFLATEANATFTVTINADTTFETNESFNITLTVGAGDNFTPLPVLIINDDAAPTITISAPPTQEGNGVVVGTTFIPAQKNVTITFTLNGATEVNCAFQWATQAVTALVGLDFIARNNTRVIPVGQTVTNDYVTILGDLSYEANEAFVVGLVGSGCSAPIPGQVAIVNDDAPPALTIAQTASVIEGTGTISYLNWVMTITPPAGLNVIVTFALNVGSTNATPTVDFTLPTGNTVIVPPGAATSNLWVRVNGDQLREYNETIALDLTSFGNATYASGYTTIFGTIIDDDPIPTLSVVDTAFVEGNVNSPRNVTISTGLGWSPYPMSFVFALTNGTAGLGEDFNAVTAQGAVAGGSGFATIVIVGDTVPEAGNETFTFTIINVTCAACPWNASAYIAKPTGVITILDDDLPFLYVAGNSATESNTSYIVFTVSIQAVQATDIVFDYVTLGGTATSGSDFTPITGTATLAAGKTSISFNVSLIDDTISEPTETVVFNVTSITSGPARLYGPGLGYILDNPADPIPALYTYNITVVEGDNGTTMGYVPLTLSFATQRTVNITYSTKDESAYAPVDYLTTEGWVAFAPGQTSQNITVYIVGDLIEELQTAFLVRLVSVTNANFGNYTAGVVISDDDYLEDAAVQSDVYEGSPSFNPRFISLIIVIGVVLIAIIASIVGFFALKRYVS